MRICIDPGHSGPVEPGACAAGLTEAAINLAIVQQLGDLLYAQGHEVIFMRTGEIESDGLAFRADMANQAGADLFLSIHCNAAARELTVKLDAHTERCERCRAWRELEPCDSCSRKEAKP